MPRNSYFPLSADCVGYRGFAKGNWVVAGRRRKHLRERASVVEARRTWICQRQDRCEDVGLDRDAAGLGMVRGVLERRATILGVETTLVGGGMGSW